MTIEEIIIQCHYDSLSWFPAIARDLPHHALSLCGEVGEFANILKKVERGSLEFNEETRMAMSSELADIFIYLCDCAAILNIDLEKAYQLKRKENIGRFGEPDHAAALERFRNNGAG